MSEDSAPVVAKKKPILPVVMVLVLLLLGGGYFMMKGKGAEKPKPAVQLAEKDTDLEEFLTNTSNPTVYVRAKMTLRLRKDFEEAKFKDELGDVRDAVINVLNGLSPDDITDPKRRARLKRTIAEAINTSLEGPLTATADAKPKAKKARMGKVQKLEPAEPKQTPGPENDWDSETGPVLKVRFLSLATQ